MWPKMHAKMRGFALLSVMIVTTLMALAIMSHLEAIQRQKSMGYKKHHVLG